VEDLDAVELSHVGNAAYDALRRKHGWHHDKLWNVTSGKVIGEVHQTPMRSWAATEDLADGHDDWFPEKMGEIMSRTKVWCDIMSLGPPDGLFLEKMKEALKTIYDNAEGSDKKVTIRMMFGNIVGMPVNCDRVIKKLTEDLPQDAGERINMWVGAWRFGCSWNHAKIIAVDGRYLHTGGHNLWDYHYLKHNPVHDLSLEMEGRVTHDGHIFANDQWFFIEKKQSTCIGQMAENIPDALPLIWKTRVIISEFPRNGATEFPPMYKKDLVPHYDRLDSAMPVISVGRYGALLPVARPADDAFLAMILSAKTIIRLGLQDLGPVCIPGTKQALPGCTWPHTYLNALGKVIWERGVDVEIVLSNPGSIPGGLGPTEACYGNGWSCVDVAAEIIKSIRKQYKHADDDDLRKKVSDNLRVCFIKHAHGKAYSNGGTVGMHAKHFIVDDVCTYIGSQNLYVCDLAEWGVIIDDEAQTKKIMEDYWYPMWEVSYLGQDCNVQEVMDGLDIDRDGETTSHHLSSEGAKLMAQAAQAEAKGSNMAEFYGTEEEDDEDDIIAPVIEVEKVGVDLSRNLELNLDVVTGIKEGEKTKVEEKAISDTKVDTEKEKTEVEEKAVSIEKVDTEEKNTETKEKSDVLEYTEVVKTKLEESDIDYFAVAEVTSEIEEKSKVEENAVTEKTMEMEGESDVDDKAVTEGTMEMEETSEVEEKTHAEEIAECTGVGANTDWKNQLEFEEVSVAEEKVGTDEIDIVEKPKLEEATEVEQKIELEERTEEGENPEIQKTEAGGKDGVEEMIVAEEKVGADDTEVVEKCEVEGSTEIVEKKVEVEGRTDAEEKIEAEVVEKVEAEEMHNAVKKEETSTAVENTEVKETAEVVNNTPVEKMAEAKEKVDSEELLSEVEKKIEAEEKAPPEVNKETEVEERIETEDRSDTEEKNKSGRMTEPDEVLLKEVDEKISEETTEGEKKSEVEHASGNEEEEDREAEDKSSALEIVETKDKSRALESVETEGQHTEEEKKSEELTNATGSTKKERGTMTLLEEMMSIRKRQQERKSLLRTRSIGAK